MAINIGTLVLRQDVWAILRKQERIMTVEQLCTKTSQELLKVKGIKESHLKTIRLALHNVGCDLAEHGGFSQEGYDRTLREKSQGAQSRQHFRKGAGHYWKTYWDSPYDMLRRKT